MMNNRLNFYSVRTVDGNQEYDYLESELPSIDIQSTITFRIPYFVERRADLISYIHYETPDLWWLILEHNNIVDPWEGLKGGVLIEIPSISEYYTFYNENVR